MSNSGYTTTSALADSLPTVFASARVVRDYEGVMQKVSTIETLGEGVGESWNEISVNKITATAFAEGEKHDNPQQLSDSLFSITPTTSGVHLVITDEVMRRVSKNVARLLPKGVQAAIERKKDQDGLLLFSGASNILGGAGTTGTSGLIAAAVTRITGNTTEHANGEVVAVFHPFQIKDFYDEVKAGIGTYPVPEGMSARVFQEGFTAPILNCKVYPDGNISIDSSDDAVGGVFAKEAVVHVKEGSPSIIVERNNKIGRGATEYLHYDSYAYGERSAGNWLYGVRFDATSPTS